MVKQSDVNKVRRAVVSHIGSKVKIRANKGRHKISVTEGIITESYPSIFLIQVKNDTGNQVKMMSFTYTDVLTRDVELTLCN